MLSYNELKPGVIFEYENQPYQVLESGFLRMQQRKPVMQTKIKNLLNGQIISRNFHQSDQFEDLENDIQRKAIKYLYNHRGEYWFSDLNDPKNRFLLPEEVVGSKGQFLKPNSEIKVMLFKEKVVDVELPAKMDLVVKETAPNDRGNTAQGGTKVAELETGAKVNVPLFINTGDTVRVNTDLGQYVERVEKK